MLYVRAKWPLFSLREECVDTAGTNLSIFSYLQVWQGGRRGGDVRQEDGEVQGLRVYHIRQPRRRPEGKRLPRIFVVLGLQIPYYPVVGASAPLSCFVVLIVLMRSSPSEYPRCVSRDLSGGGTVSRTYLGFL